MRFRLVHLLYLNVIVALFFTMRSWWIMTEDDRVAGLTPIVLSVICGATAGLARCKYSTIFFLAALVSASASLAFALECIFESTATEFLRRDFIGSQYSSDVELNLFAALILTGIATVIGDVAGTAARLAVCYKRR